ncbi:hypothetical protein DL98DRAFT_508302 [Cadophora sp. DSE1049]|nr:hypothetical protein DL98DRAFT_508302 [Cadophora sp. DSE1049]
MISLPLCMSRSLSLVLARPFSKASSTLQLTPCIINAHRKSTALSFSTSIPLASRRHRQKTGFPTRDELNRMLRIISAEGCTARGDRALRRRAAETRETSFDQATGPDDLGCGFF